MLTFRKNLRPIAKSIEKLLGIQILGKTDQYHARWSSVNGFSASLYHALGISGNVIFDVGANIGQSTSEFRRHFPSASIHSFEPGIEAFNALSRAFIGQPLVSLNQKAVSSISGKIQFADFGTEQSHIIHGDTNTGVTIDCISIDDYCQQNHISSIDILKTDTEGHELEVIEGAANILRSGRVSAIIIEFGIGDGKLRLDELAEVLSGFDFGILLTFDNHYWASGLPEFCNALFVRKELLRKCAPIPPC